jgi:LysR family hydrogen peroxide-inducible transcriptional activator
MNIQQLEYIVAVDTYRHFAKASEKSFVTQPTLSAMIQKLEEELAVKIFDRSKHPVIPTREGEEILRRAKQILSEVNGIKNFAHELRGETMGELRLGIIPTLAPYLLPLFLKSFREKNPGLTLYIKEMLTEEIILGLKTGQLDIGLLATPLHEHKIAEHSLFCEELFAYANGYAQLADNRPIMLQEIDLSNLWLIEEGHCLRNQVFNLCEMKKLEIKKENLHYQAGSIETLINLVDNHSGMTIIPELATFNLKTTQKKKIHQFAEPQPMREISLVVEKDFPRKKLIKQLKTEILCCVPLNLNRRCKVILEVKSQEELNPWQYAALA